MAHSGCPWPKKGDKLFVAAPHDEGKVFHLGSITWNEPVHADAFKVAADTVIESYENAPESPYYDELLFPVVYLYRHAIELKLKEIVGYGIALNCYSKADAETILGGHNLARLWTKAKLAILKRWPDGDLAVVRSVEAVVNEMHQVDPTGQTMRYAADRDRRPHMHDRLPKSVSLRSLRATIDNAFSFLDACASGIDQGISDMRSAMR